MRQHVDRRHRVEPTVSWTATTTANAGLTGLDNATLHRQRELPVLGGGEPVGVVRAVFHSR